MPITTPTRPQPGTPDESQAQRMHSSDASLPASQDLRYPIGRFEQPSPEQLPSVRRLALQQIAELPGRLSAAYAGLDSAQLDTPYRPGGWTLRQLAHHVADSHLNAYTRLRFALTEEWPTIKPYDEAVWAELADARTLPIESSLTLLHSLHLRWVTLLRSLEEPHWLRGYIHPENGRTTIEAMTALYGWHGRHHTAHVLGLRERLGW